MKISEVWDNVKNAGLDRKPNSAINADLARMAGGNFNLGESFSMGVAGVNSRDIQQMAASAKQVIDNEFNGDAHAGLAFLQRVQQSPSIKNMDFTELVNNGTAHRMALLERADPDSFSHVLAGNYANSGALTSVLGGAETAVAAPATQPAATVPSTRPTAPGMQHGGRS